MGVGEEWIQGVEEWVLVATGGSLMIETTLPFSNDNNNGTKYTHTINSYYNYTTTTARCPVGMPCTEICNCSQSLDWLKVRFDR